MSAAERLTQILETVPRRLVDLSSDEASRSPAPDRWSKKEFLGHLIDSAGNNLQRIVRMQIEHHLEFPSYQQESWVKLQSYATESWHDLVNLWLLLNRHLLHVIQAVPESSLVYTWAIGGREPITLAEMIDSYVDHMEHHLGSIMGDTP